MSDAKPTIWCGNGKVVGQYGNIAVSICLSDIPDEFITEAKNGKRYVNVIIAEKQQEDQYGKTHSVKVDTWKPDGSKGQASNSAKQADAPADAMGQDNPDDDLPF